ncbi:hypothetical protein SynPROS71_00957 [Synechococcus sp. PROS-7-1]|nr:hypothetical protein SynPROS71_00957 [Synechococcus sp. PROS-7-1]
MSFQPLLIKFSVPFFQGGSRLKPWGTITPLHSSGASHD